MVAGAHVGGLGPGPSARWCALPGGSASRRLAGFYPSVLFERAPGIEPLTGEELVGRHLLGGLPPPDQPLVDHPVDVPLPLGRVLVTERALVVVREEHRQRRW